MCAAPCTEAFSAFHTSSRSEYSFSNAFNAPSKVLKRFRDASSASFLSASRSDLQLNDATIEFVERLRLRINSMRISEPASSIKSMALSGNCRSEI